MFAANEVERRIARLEVSDVEAETAKMLAEEGTKRARLIGDDGDLQRFRG